MDQPTIQVNMTTPTGTVTVEMNIETLQSEYCQHVCGQLNQQLQQQQQLNQQLNQQLQQVGEQMTVENQQLVEKNKVLVEQLDIHKTESDIRLHYCIQKSDEVDALKQQVSDLLEKVDYMTRWNSEVRELNEDILQSRTSYISRKPTCGYSGGRCVDGTRCERDCFLYSNGRCRDHQ